MNFKQNFGWRIPLYKRYFFYIKTLNNYREVIQYERTGKHFSNYRIRNGSIINFNDITSAHNFFREIWVNETYTKFFNQDNNPKTIVDIGANIGIFTLFANYLWPESTITAYEPAPENFILLQKNINSSKLKNIKAINLAASNQKGTYRFVIKDYPGAHSFYDDISNEATNIQKLLM